MWIYTGHCSAQGLVNASFFETWIVWTEPWSNTPTRTLQAGSFTHQAYIVHGPELVTVPPPHYSPTPTFFRLTYVQNMKWDVTSKKMGRTR